MNWQNMSSLYRALNRMLFCPRVLRCINYTRHGIKYTMNIKCYRFILTSCRHFNTRKSFSEKQNNSKCVDTNSRFETYKHGIRLSSGIYNIDLPFVWLRDHCRCEQCFNQETFQRKTDGTSFTLSTVNYPESVDLDNRLLNINWKDGHITSYSVNWLIQNTYHEHNKGTSCRFLWNKELLQSVPIPIVQYEEYMDTEEGLKTHLSSMVKFGFSIVSGVEQNHNGTLEVSKRICHLMETFYGHSWQFTTDMAFKDTAYTTYALGAHTDNTYFSSPSGIQVFHVVEHTGEGGQTLLVDGFYAAEKLRKEFPDSFDALSKYIIPHEYYDEERHIKTLATVLTTHPATQDLISIRYNRYDRATLNTLSVDNIRNFYESYDRLSKKITNPENEYWIKLQPDMVLFVDNWRVLHGRSGFTGKRHVSGCYLPRDDWISRARIFGLLNT